ncbi:MAG: VWA domain-containing protein, partial [Chloroflexi bacterium]|nr:VWA domain-containing protein [Chloroflexota bacterium]
MIIQNSEQTTYDFTAHLTHFCRVLRSHGLLISPQETADVMRALSAVDMMDRGRVYWSLRALLLSRRDEIPIYDSLFERFWNFEELPLRPHIESDDDLVGGAKEFRRTPSFAMMPEEDESAQNTLVQMLRTGASSRATMTPPDLSVLRADELSELSTIAARMIRAMASRPGRRRKRHPRKGIPDLRGAMRLNLSSGGDAVVLPRKRRVPRTPRLLVMLDVSGSMERHVQLLLQLVFAVTQHTKRVETFVFSTSATRVTREMSAPSFSEALTRVGSVVRHWSGGTRIGEALAHVNTRHEHVLT